jgi:hypothetical protein
MPINEAPVLPPMRKIEGTTTPLNPPPSAPGATAPSPAASAPSN